MGGTQELTMYRGGAGLTPGTIAREIPRSALADTLSLSLLDPSGFFDTMRQVEDKRNLIDKYKSQPIEAIVADLDYAGSRLEIAVENLERDFNMGTIIRNANAFGVRHVHIIGRRQWNKRGAMMTDKYLHVHYHATLDDFFQAVRHTKVIAVDNVEGSTPLIQTELPERCTLVFGSEKSGISPELSARCQSIVAIEQFGSTRSVNVGVAAGIAMYEWLRRHRLSDS